MENIQDKIRSILMIIGGIFVLSVIITVVLPTLLTLVLILAGIFIIIGIVISIMYYFRFKRFAENIEAVRNEFINDNEKIEHDIENDKTTIVIEKEENN